MANSKCRVRRPSPWLPKPKSSPISATPNPIASRPPTGPLHLSRLLYKSTSFFAKQTQFAQSQNDPNPLPRKALWKHLPPPPPPKQTQSNPIPPPPPIFLVYDGIRGHRGGAPASKIISENLPVVIENAYFCHLFLIYRLYCDEAIISNVQWGRENAGYDNRDRAAPGQPGRQ